MGLISSLIVYLGANTSEFDSKIQKSDGFLAELGFTAKGTNKSLAGMADGIGHTGETASKMGINLIQAFGGGTEQAQHLTEALRETDDAFDAFGKALTLINPTSLALAGVAAAATGVYVAFKYWESSSQRHIQAVNEELEKTVTNLDSVKAAQQRSFDQFSKYYNIKKDFENDDARRQKAAAKEIHDIKDVATAKARYAEEAKKVVDIEKQIYDLTFKASQNERSKAKNEILKKQADADAKGWFNTEGARDEAFRKGIKLEEELARTSLDREHIEREILDLKEQQAEAAAHASIALDRELAIPAEAKKHEEEIIKLREDLMRDERKAVEEEIKLTLEAEEKIKEKREKEKKDLMALRESLMGAIMTPMDKFLDDMVRASEAFAKGAISKGELDLIEKKSREGISPGPTRFAGAMAAGSEAAHAVLVNFRHQNDPAKDAAITTAREAKRTADGIDRLERLERERKFVTIG